MRRAHAPYSDFRVGAALRGAGGAIHVGANVENASYSQTQCAEASAIGAMIAAGETRITAVAIVAERSSNARRAAAAVSACRSSRTRRRPCILGRPGSEPLTTTLGELLPLAFESGALEQ